MRVKAVVMTRDDSTGGWLAQDGGALTRVGVCRLLPPELAPVPASSLSQFLIRGERLQDKQVKPRKLRQSEFNVDRVLTCVTPTGDSGLSAEEGPRVHHRKSHVSPLEGGGQEVRPVLSESGRRQSVRQRRAESHRGPGRRYAAPQRRRRRPHGPRLMD